MFEVRPGRWPVVFWILGLNALLQAQPRIPSHLRLSKKISEGLIVRKVQPTYPQEARRNHVQGSVAMQAEISKAGVVEGLRVLSGYPFLAEAATIAVKPWKYKPSVLNGKPFAVETQVPVRFTLESK